LGGEIGVCSVIENVWWDDRREDREIGVDCASCEDGIDEIVLWEVRQIGTFLLVGEVLSVFQLSTLA